MADDKEIPPPQPPDDLLDALRRIAQTSNVRTLIPLWEALPKDIPTVDCSKRHDH